jgi:hypothetical protein
MKYTPEPGYELSQNQWGQVIEVPIVTLTGEELAEREKQLEQDKLDMERFGINEMYPEITDNGDAVSSEIIRANRSDALLDARLNELTKENK